MLSDASAAIDVEEAKKNRGLGMVSMQERVHLVRGRFAVESELGRRTKIAAAVPVDSVSSASAAETQADRADSAGAA